MRIVESEPTSDRFRPITPGNVDKLPQWASLSDDVREGIDVVSRVLPFRVNNYVVQNLIDWDRAPDDPMFRLTFPHRDMLQRDHYAEIQSLLNTNADKAQLDAAVNRIRYELNPQPAGQLTHNVPHLNGQPLAGAQHKYRETILFFPSQGQTCHAYCTFCFRWAQFVGLDDLKFASKEADDLVAYLRQHPEVTDVLLTGGDPMVMKTSVLEKYIEPLLTVESVQTIRIGTKAPAYWPQRFVTDSDADDLLRLFERVVDSGRQLAIMGHYSHPVEFSTPIARDAVKRIRSAGANIRMQSPLIRGVNDDARVWEDMWRQGVQLGMVPYYMFVERDTGARGYFDTPLVEAWKIFREAFGRVSGLARTVRGPSMSCFPGKCHVLGVTEIGGKKAFVLEFLQARDPDLVRRPFFADYDPKAIWFDQLKPFSTADAPFFATPDAHSAPPPITRDALVVLNGVK